MSEIIPAPGHRRAPTMADVARRAGVSRQTVSRVLRGRPGVGEAARGEVLRAVRELRYRRNPSARALATRRTRMLGVVTCDPTLFGPASTLSGLQATAQAGGYLLSAVTLRRFTADALVEAIGRLSEWGVEGAVVAVPHRAVVMALDNLRLPFPVVTVAGSPRASLPGVSVDQELGAGLVTGHLMDAGHRTVWHVAGPADWPEADARARGWRAVLEDAGAEVPPPIVGDWTPLSGYRAGQELAGRAHGAGVRRGVPDVTAVFVANDHMALGVLRALREAGLPVPGRVAVAGFDDIPEAEFCTPPLTTVRQDFAAVGRAGIRLLVERLESGAAGDERVVMEPRLIVRASSAVSPAAPGSTRGGGAGAMAG